MYSQIQVYLYSWNKAEFIDDIKLSFLDWDADLTNLVKKHRYMLSIVNPFFFNTQQLSKNIDNKDGKTNRIGIITNLILLFIYHLAYSLGIELVKDL